MATLHQKSAQLALCLLLMIFSGGDGSSKRLKGPDYKESLMRKFLGSLFLPKPFPPLPDHYFSVQDPFNKSEKATRYRFNLTDGTLVMNSTELFNTSSNICEFRRNVWKRAFCILPVSGSFATYAGKLSYGQPVKDKFNITTVFEPYTGWTSPAEISADFDIREISGEMKLVLGTVFVTEFVVNTISSPPFKNFSVFKGKPDVAEKVWHKFTDYVFRKCKQDIRSLLKKEYNVRLRAAADAVGIVDNSLLWKI